MENREYWQGVSSKPLVQRFGKHASPTQDCTVKQTAGEKRKIAVLQQTGVRAKVLAPIKLNSLRIASA